MTEPDLSCPHCGVSLRGDPIPETRRALYPGRTHYDRQIGVEVPEVYDGVLFWRCPDCGQAFHRWSEGHRLRATAEPFVAASTRPDATRAAGEAQP